MNKCATCSSYQTAYEGVCSNEDAMKQICANDMKGSGITMSPEFGCIFHSDNKEESKEPSLFDKVESAVSLDYQVSFMRDINQLSMRLKNMDSGKYIIQVLPLSDHFYESRVVDCLKYMMDNIEE